jgi:uncharacterized protein
MNCPVCRSELRALDRLGIEIDTCPQCRGVWLDRGELDKLLERAAQYEEQLHNTHRRRYERDDDSGEFEAYNGRRPQSGNGHPQGNGHYPPQQKKSFWSRMFDD